MKKKILALITSLIMVVGLFTIMPTTVLAADTAYWTDSGNYDTTWYTGGTNPYTISSAADLAGLAVLTNGGNDFMGDIITLTANIDVSAHLWTPIGTSANAKNFRGSFNGGGFTIKGVTTNDSTLSYQGLFGVSNGTIKNVGVINSHIKGFNNTGGVVGQNSGGTVTNCYNE